MFKTVWLKENRIQNMLQTPQELEKCQALQKHLILNFPTVNSRLSSPFFTFEDGYTVTIRQNICTKPVVLRELIECFKSSQELINLKN